MTSLTITVDELRQLLERGTPVTVLDVRPTAERAEWIIPGSVHLDAYDALRGGDPGPLACFHPSNSGPVVTVCAAGKTSRLAAEVLRRRGVGAISLEGGMRAWSLAWNTADVPCPDIPVHIVQVRRTGKGCLSYLVGAGDAAAVVDASVDPGVYLELAQRRGWRIQVILDTHVHADHLSRARALAGRAGATLHLPATDRVTFDYAPLRDGDEIHIGAARLRAHHTPGHTPESTCYLLHSRVLFTGDTLFLAAVGRPDLGATREEARARARLLHSSLRRLLALPASTVVLPAHASAPVAFDGQPLSAALGDVRDHTALLHVDEPTFVNEILARVPPTPPHHHRIVQLNEAGALPDGDPNGLEAGANRCAVV